MKSTPRTRESFGNGVQEFHYRDLLEVFLEQKRLVAGCIAFFIAIGVLYLLLAPKVYRAQATVQVEMQSPKIINIQDVQAEGPKGVMENAERLKTIEDSLRARSLYLRVIETLHLDQNPEFMKHRLFVHSPITQEDVVRALDASLHITPRRNTFLIDISADHPSRELAESIVRTLIAEFKTQVTERRGGLTENAYQFLMKESERLQNSLKLSEMKVQEFKEQHHSVAFEDEKDNTVIERLKRLNLEVSQARSDHMKADAEVVALSERYKKKHPKYIEALNEAQKARVLEEDLTKRLKEQEQFALDLNRQSIEFNSLVRQVDSDKALYERVLGRLKEMDLAKGMDPAAITVVDEPYSSSEPIRPRPLFILVASLVGGLLAGLGAALIWNLFDSSIKTAEQAERLFHVPVLTTIPPTGRLGMGGGKTPQGFEKLVVLDRPNSAATEAFRFLTASLGAGSDRKVILFTSAVPNEGKTFTSCNYAVTLARQGLQTLLIQSDVKHQTLHEFFPVVVSNPGLSEYLEGTCDLNEVTCPTGIERLFVIPAGAVPMTPSERFAHERWLKLLDGMSASFDRIIIDTGPVNLVSNTLTLAQSVNTVILVVQSCKTPVRVIQAAYNRLLQADIQPTGLVLNRFPLEHLLGDYQSYYSDGPMRRGFLSSLRQRMRSRRGEHAADDDLEL